jgi:SAM-dependent methyltransferase
MTERRSLSRQLMSMFDGLDVKSVLGLIWYAPENLREVFALWSDRFDAVHGTDTGRPVSADQLNGVGDHGADAVFYWPTDPVSFDRMLDAVAPDLPGASFVDVGSGKGRMLLLAAHRPFAQLIGVEFSPPLCKIAERNVAIYRTGHPNLPPIRTDCADAATWPIPDGPLIVYLFDPFGPAVLAPLIDNLRASLERDPRPCRVLYRAPAHDAVLRARGFSVHLRQGRNWRFEHPWTIYRYDGGVGRG